MSHPLYVAFVWHMHQPYYRELGSGACSMPWVRLHGTKDYLDMVARLEAFPALHQTFNLVPSLLDQLDEYAHPEHPASDRFLDLSRKPATRLTEAEKRFLLEWFFMANWDRMIKPHPRYHDLLVKRGRQLQEIDWTAVMAAFRPHDYLDLQVWFNLSWIDPWLRQQDAELSRLQAKGANFTEAEKTLVLVKQLDILRRILPAYRAAETRGQIELTTSPYYHPIMPLLCDPRSAHAALPHLPLPSIPFRHPEDAAWHLEQAVARHTAAFGRRPNGLWPSEGSVSEDVVRLALGQGIGWIATDEEILWRTLKRARAPSLLYRPHALKRAGGTLAIVFRDRELSDLIGFVYSQWNARAAADDFLLRLDGIAQQFRSAAAPALVSIILDGENAWECFPNDGHDFFQELYQRLAEDQRFRLVTVSEYLRQFPVDHEPSLPDLSPGSWIDGNFATWIGQNEKNRAWELLAKARQSLAALPPFGGGGSGPEPVKGPERRDEAWRNLYIAEGSDWMWWFGDTHSSAQDEEFDRLFRTHVMNAYRAGGLPVPEELENPIITASVSPVYEPTATISPRIDGRESTYYEWLYAGRLDLRKSYAAIHRGQQLLRVMHYGFNATHFFFRFDLEVSPFRTLKEWRLVMEIPDRQVEITISPSASAQQASAVISPPSSHQVSCALHRILELAVPKTALAVPAGESFQLRVVLHQGADELERYPTQGSFRVPVPPDDFQTKSWSV